MSENLTKYGEANNLPTLKAIENFQFLLNKDPELKNIKRTPDNKADQLPIGIIENTLDEIYGGLWQTTNWQYKVIANELCGQLTIHVFHPVAKMWLQREGTAAKAIQMVSLSETEKAGMTKQERNMYAQTLSNKISNCIEKQLPAVKALCLKNAAASLGVVFGRNLNRKDLDAFEFEPMSEQASDYESKAMEALQLLESSTVQPERKSGIKIKINKASYKGLLTIIKYLNDLQ